jgi:hypothetical protein
VQGTARRRFAQVLAATMMLALAGCPCPEDECEPTVTYPEAGISPAFDICLHLESAYELLDRGSGPDFETVTLRRSSGDVRIYVGFQPDYPDRSVIANSAGGEMNPNFIDVADTTESGTRRILYGRTREAGGAMLFVMFTGAESSLAGDDFISGWDILDCPPPR